MLQGGESRGPWRRAYARPPPGTFYRVMRVEDSEVAVDAPGGHLPLGNGGAERLGDVSSHAAMISARDMTKGRERCLDRMGILVSLAWRGRLTNSGRRPARTVPYRTVLALVMRFSAAGKGIHERRAESGPR